jgi:DNA-binding NarL/FixJ family response regulator
MSLKVLLILDGPSGAVAVRDALISASGRSAFDLEWVRSCAEGRKRLSPGEMEASGTRAISAVLVDLFLSDSKGIETFDQIFATAPHIPILVLCAQKHEGIARIAVRNGAQDYLTHDRIDRYHLPKAINSIVERTTNAEVLFEERESARK